VPAKSAAIRIGKQFQRMAAPCASRLSVSRANTLCHPGSCSFLELWRLN
jgi:hypothetical protein